VTRIDEMRARLSALAAQTDEARSIHVEPSRIAAASPLQLAQLVTMFVRGDRFNEGYLLEAFVKGHLTAIARRAQALLDDPGALAAALGDWGAWTPRRSRSYPKRGDGGRPDHREGGRAGHR
jgi:hypothetical protein